MLFQTLDIKNQCVGYYLNDAFIYSQPLGELSRTWDYSPALRELDIEYARVYCGGQSLTAMCPERYQNMWTETKERLRSYLKSFAAAKINLDEVCFYELVPEQFLFEFCDIKNEITKSVFAQKTRPPNYRLFANILKLLSDIRRQPLKVNIGAIKHKGGSLAGRNFINRLQQVRRVCDYNPWGTITGRLATNPNSFPIMTMKKEFRACLEPQNDWFVELDYNAAEVRTLLALSNQEQPVADIHEWNMKNVYTDITDRAEAKKKIFAWLYSRRSNQRAEQFYNKELVLQKYWKNGVVKTEFEREIPNVDNHHALNYIVQSTTSDLVLSRAIEINEKLRGMATNIGFTLHDSIILDLKDEDRYIIPELIKTFANTKFGKYKVNVAAGKNFGDMRGMNL